MKKSHTAIWAALSLGAISPIARAQTPPSPAVPVTIDNYNRAQSAKRNGRSAALSAV